MDLSADWIVGFTDGEGCFYVGIYRHPEMKTGWQVLPEFRIVQHEKDIRLLYAIKRFFRCGKVRKNHEQRYEVCIRKLDCLKAVISFFRRHPLKTSKRFEFEKFADVVRMMQEGRHLTPDGLRKIAGIVRRMNTSHHPRLEDIYKELGKKI